MANNKKMMRIFHICILILLILVSNFISCKSSSPVTVHTLDAKFSEVLFFNYGTHVYGLDPESYEKKIDFEFQQNVIFGDVSDDGRIFIADNGKGQGVWGKKIFVINSQGKIINTIATLVNPLQMKIIDNILIADSAVYYKNGYTALTFFNANNYTQIWQSKKISNWFVNKTNSSYMRHAFIGVAPLKSMDRKSRILKVNLDTLTVTREQEYTSRHPFDIFSMCLQGNKMIIAFNESKEINVFSLPGKKPGKILRLKDFVHMPDVGQPGNIWFFDVRPMGNSLVITIKDLLPTMQYQELLFFNGKTFCFEKAVSVDANVDLESSNLCHVYDAKLFYQNMNRILIIDAHSGKMLRLITL